MMANKTESNPQKYVVFTPVGWPIVRSHQFFDFFENHSYDPEEGSW